MAEPSTIGEVDRQLAEYRQILTTVSLAGRVAVWEQVDRLLDLRRKLAVAERRAARRALNVKNHIP